MNLQDFEYLNSNIDSSTLFGSDTSVANLFLLQEKYNTELKIHKNILFRYYYGDERLWFPHPDEEFPGKLVKNGPGAHF